MFARLTFAWICFRGCKFRHILRKFSFSDGEILLILRELISVVARYVMFISSMIIGGINF